MYYVIQRHHNNYQKHYFAYVVAKFIAAKNTQNVIFEIKRDGLMKRKWAPKEDIILLTDNKEVFLATLEHLETIKNHHLKNINAAQEQLNKQINHFNETMQKEFETIKLSSPSCILN